MSAGSHGGEHVEVEGSFDNWGVRHTMQKSGKDFTIIKLLPPGVYQVRQYLCLTSQVHWQMILSGATLSSD